MKKYDFSNFLEEIEDELFNFKEELDMVNVKKSSKKKEKGRKSSKKSIIYGAESSEGRSVMTNTMEGKGIEGISLEGRSLMTDSLEGKSQMNSSIEGKSIESTKSIFNHDIYTLDKKEKNISGIKSRLKGKGKLLDALILSEIVGKPKSLR